MKDNTLKFSGKIIEGIRNLVPSEKIVKNEHKIDCITEFIDLDFTNVKEIASGIGYYFILLNNGTLYGCGSNYNGCLGLPIDISESNEFVKILDNVKHINAYFQSTYILMNDNSLNVCGYNNYRQLGISDDSDSYDGSLTKVLEGVKNIYIGSNRSVFLMNDGTIKCSGSSANGLLSLAKNDYNTVLADFDLNGKTDSNISKIELIDDACIVFFEDGTIKASGSNKTLMSKLTGQSSSFKLIDVIIDLEDVKDVSENIFIALKDGTILCKGKNYNGELGLGNTNKYSDFVEFSCDEKLLLPFDSEYLFPEVTISDLAVSIKTIVLSYNIDIKNVKTSAIVQKIKKNNTDEVLASTTFNLNK